MTTFAVNSGYLCLCYHVLISFQVDSKCFSHFSYAVIQNLYFNKMFSFSFSEFSI